MEHDRDFPNEIIDFPAVLARTDTMEVVAEFRQLVRPDEHPQLSSFCTELTGITQARPFACLHDDCAQMLYVH